MYSDNEGNMPNWLKWLIGGIAFVGATVLTVLTAGAITPLIIGMGISIISGGLIQGVISKIAVVIFGTDFGMVLLTAQCGAVFLL